MYVKSCEALTLHVDSRGMRSWHWDELPPMQEARFGFACAVLGGCVIVAGGTSASQTVEVYEEALRRWRRLPCRLPHAQGLYCTGTSTLM